MEWSIFQAFASSFSDHIRACTSTFAFSSLIQSFSDHIRACNSSFSDQIRACTSTSTFQVPIIVSVTYHLPMTYRLFFIFVSKILLGSISEGNNSEFELTIGCKA